MNFARDPSRIQIFDTTNRDGEQATKRALYGGESKLVIARELAKAGVDRIEAGYPNSSPEDFETVRRIADEVEGPMIFGLSRVPIDAPGKISFADIDAVFASVKNAQYRGIHTFSIMFDPASLKAYGHTREQVVQGAVMGVAHARKLLGSNGQVEFSFQNAASAPLEWIVDGYKRVVEAGADVVNVPDTNGTRTPDEIKETISVLRRELPSHVLISIHAHNDLGLAVANSLAAIKGGADIVEGTINGIGERAGNTALEEVLVNVYFRPELYGNRASRFDLSMLNHLSRLVQEHYDVPVQEHKAIVGANAFRHRSGIHQDGMVKDRLYEFMSPEIVGWNGETFELSARSGTAGVGQRLMRLGYDLSPEFVRHKIMPAFKELADERRDIGDADLVVLVDSANGYTTRYSLADMRISQDSGGRYNVDILLNVEGKGVVSSKAAASGSLPSSISNGDHPGSVSAIISTIDSIVGSTGLNLVSYEPVNIGSGKDAIAEVTVVLSPNGYDGKIKPVEGMIVGRGRHQDTLRASAMAYIDALNKVAAKQASPLRTPPG